MTVPRLLRWIAAAAVWGIAIGVGLCMGAARLGGHHWAFDLFSHFHVQYLGLAAGAAGVGLLVRSRWGTVAALLAALAAGREVAPLWTETGPSEGANGERVRVVALNVLTSNRKHGEVITWLVQQKADVIVAQEIDDRWAGALDAGLDGYLRLPTDTLSGDNFGMAIYLAAGWAAEAPPIIHWTELETPWIEVVIQRRDVDLRVFGVHTIPPLNARFFRSRGDQLRSAVAAAGDSIEPAVIAGDFNATIWSKALREALDGSALRPACLGHGPWGSWPSRLMFTGGILIDHVLVDDRLAVLSHRVGRHVGSDHRGIVVDVVPRSVDSE